MPIISGGGGGGGGFTPVGCLATVSALDVHVATAHQLKWDGIADNYWDFNSLGAIPAGLGMAFAFDGSDGTLTTTVAGVWAFTLIAVMPEDAGWQGQLSFPFVSGGPVTADVNRYDAPVTLVAAQTLQLPAGAADVARIVTGVISTANPYTISANLSILRLA